MLAAGALIIGSWRISLSRIFGAPQEECSRLIPRMVRSTWNGSSYLSLSTQRIAGE